MTKLIKKEELDELLSKMPVAVSEQVKSELNDKVNGLPLKSGGKNTINQEDLVQIVKSQTNSPKEVSEKIRQSIQASKKASQKENEKDGAEEDELLSGADNLIQNCPLKEGTAIIYSHKDEYGNDIQTTYVIKKKLSQGGFGITYSAVRGGEDSGELVVVKEFYPVNSYRNIETGNLHYSCDKAEVEYNLEIFKKEPQRILELKEVKAKNLDVHSMYKLRDEWNKLNLVIPITPAFENKGKYYYVMEYVPGYPLSHIMQSFENSVESYVALPLHVRLQIIDQLCVAIINLHSINCVHQDISPNNVMINWDENGELHLKVIDYGLATSLFNKSGRMSSHIKTAGTPGFSDIFTRMQAYQELYRNGQKEKLKLIDVYSLGAMLGYLCLLNVEFIQTKEFWDNYELILQGDEIYGMVEIEEGDTPEIIACKYQTNLIKLLVRQATTANLYERIQSAEEFQARLHEIMGVNPEIILRGQFNAWVDNMLETITAMADNVKGKVISGNLAKAKWDEAKALMQEAGTLLFEVKEAISDSSVSMEEIGNAISDAREKYERSLNLFADAEKLSKEAAKEEATKKLIEKKETEAPKISKPIEKPSIPQNEVKPNQTTILTPRPGNKMKKILIGVLVVALLGLGGYALIGNNNDTEVSKSQSENVEMTSQPNAEDQALVNVNKLMLKANSESSAIEELKKVMASDAMILYREGETNVNTNFTFSSLYSSGNNQFIIGKTHRVVEVGYNSQDKINVIILEKIN